MDVKKLYRNNEIYAGYLDAETKKKRCQELMEAGSDIFFYTEYAPCSIDQIGFVDLVYDRDSGNGTLDKPNYLLRFKDGQLHGRCQHLNEKGQFLDIIYDHGQAISSWVYGKIIYLDEWRRDIIDVMRFVKYEKNEVSYIECYTLHDRDFLSLERYKDGKLDGWCFFYHRFFKRRSGFYVNGVRKTWWSRFLS